MLRHGLFLLAAVAIAVGISLLLIPRGEELALLHLKDQDYSAALARYQAQAARDAPVLKPSVAMALATLHLYQGDVNAAIAVLERFVGEHREHRKALEQLAALYHQAQRPHDYLAIEERLARLDPTPQHLRTLSRLYERYQRHDDRIAVLETLASRFSATPAERVDLAKLRAVRGQLPQAARTLLGVWDETGEAMDEEPVMLLLALLVDAGEDTRAAEIADRWLAAHTNAWAVAEVATLLQSRGKPAVALAVLDRAATRMGGDKAFLALLTDFRLEAGQADRVYADLSALDHASPLAPPLLARLLGAALQVRKTEFALQRAKEVDWSTLPDWLIVELAAAAVPTGDTELATRALAAHGDGWLAGKPVLAAELALVLGRTALARDWAQRADTATDLDPARRLALADIHRRLGDAAAARRTLESIRVAEIADDGLPLLANLYVQLDAAETGVQRLEALTVTRSTPAALAAWAVVAAAAGREAAVVDWLEGLGGQERSPETLLDLLFIARDTGQTQLEWLAASRLYALRPTPKNRLHLAAALVHGSRPAEALEHVRPMLPGDKAVEEVYWAALFLAWRQGLPVGPELERLVEKRWTVLAGDPSAQGQLVHNLLASGADEIALPRLQMLAAGGANEWVHAYAETLKRLGRTQERLSFLAGLARDRRLPRELRRDLAHELLAAGRRQEAEAALLALATGRSSASTDVKTLLFLWGPRPAPQAIDWLAGQAEKATGTEQAEWAGRLTELGAARRALTVLLGSGGAPAADDPRFGAYLHALAASGQRQALARALAQALEVESRPSTLRTYARLARDHGLREAAEQAYGRLAAVVPGDTEAIRYLAEASAAAGNMRVARDWLERLFRLSEGDFEVRFLYADVLQALGRSDQARAQYRRALTMIEALDTPTTETRLAHAQILHRLGHTRAAVSAMAKLHRQRPEDLTLRADYASALLDTGELERAERVLAGP